jgi:hypothetical protein
MPNPLLGALPKVKPFGGHGASAAVVEPAGGDFQRLSVTLAGDAVDETMLTGYPPRPKPLKLADQRLGLADADEGRA